MGLKRERRAANCSLARSPRRPLLFHFVLMVPLPSSPRVRVFGWRIELWIHGKGGPSLLLTSEADDFDSIRWLVLDLFGPFLCSCACRSGCTESAAARSSNQVGVRRGAQERPVPALVGSRAGDPGAEQQYTHSSSCKAGRRFGPWHGTWQQGGKH